MFPLCGVNTSPFGAYIAAYMGIGVTTRQLIFDSFIAFKSPICLVTTCYDSFGSVTIKLFEKIRLNRCLSSQRYARRLGVLCVHRSHSCAISQSVSWIPTMASAYTVVGKDAPKDVEMESGSGDAVGTLLRDGLVVKQILNHTPCTQSCQSCSQKPWIAMARRKRNKVLCAWVYHIHRF